LKKVIILWVFLAFLLRLQISFLNYLDFIYSPVREVKAKVINQYKKKNYYVLKLKNREVTFYTTNRDDLKNLLNENVSLKIFPQKISFFGYLKTFYVPSFDLRLLPLKSVEYFIEKQHDSKEMQNLFKALFLAEAVDYGTRQKLSALGISHLFALSGFHLGFISLILFLVFGGVYKFFQRFFPYRNRWIDIGVLVLGVEFFYLYVSFFPASLIRAYIMEVVLFLFAFYLKNPFSLKVLLITVLIGFYIFFMKVFGIGFLLSVVGVYYIYLFFRYFKPTFLNGIFLSFYLFLMMFVWGHCFFSQMNIYQLFSPVVNVAFSIFYPLEVFLHMLGIGGILDGWIEWYLSFGEKFYYVNITFWFLVLFAFLSVLAFFKKWAFYGINLLALIIILASIGGDFG
jgi:competence protein ComEC